MAIVKRHIAPDGLLQLIVNPAEDGNRTVGFDGSKRVRRPGNEDPGPAGARFARLLQRVRARRDR
jgi:hypothetical protein